MSTNWRNLQWLCRRLSPADRFWMKVDGGDVDTCWPWTAYTDRDGYGAFMASSTERISAHRWSWQHLRGDIPRHLVIDHLCRNRACVNPWHMDLVTAGVNALRGDTFTGRNAAKTRCPRGHAYEPAKRNHRGARICLVCKRSGEASRRSAARGVSA